HFAIRHLEARILDAQPGSGVSTIIREKACAARQAGGSKNKDNFCTSIMGGRTCDRSFLQWRSPRHYPSRRRSAIEGEGRRTEFMEDLPGLPDQSALTPANFTTLPHFSVSSTMSLPKSLGEPVSAMPPRSASRAFILGSATPASISLLSLSMISTGVL